MWYADQEPNIAVPNDVSIQIYTSNISTWVSTNLLLINHYHNGKATPLFALLAMHEASSRYSENASSTSSRFFDKLRPWKSSVAGRRKAALGTTRKDELVSASDPNTELAVASSSKRVEMDGSGTSTPGSVSGSGSASTHGSGSRGVHRDVRVEASRSPISGIEAEPSRSAVQPNGVEGIPTSRLEEEEVENGYEWEVDSDVGSDVQPDTFSWIDPSIIGTEGFHQSVSLRFEHFCCQ